MWWQTKKKKGVVFVGMSGGVDSSVSAALLKEQGYDVVGVFMKTWSPDWMPCTWPLERRDAMRVAAKLDIPFLTFDLEEEYKRGVIDYMLAEYEKGRTPNPDVMCNREVKFGAFLRRARSMGADFVATGHYAQVVDRESQNVDRRSGMHNDSRFTLHVSRDSNKDQSYFLWTLGQEELAHILFPIGYLTKPEVRTLAAKYELPVAWKKDSQGLCFVGNLNVKDFLKRHLEVRPGDVVDEKGEVIGTHEGSLLYTVGERHGFTITKKSPDEQPYYVIAKNHERNELVVAHSDIGSPREYESAEIVLKSVNWVARTEPDFSKIYQGRIRYRQKLEECRLEKMSTGLIKVIFSHSQRAVTPGQSLVIYDGDVVMGGGIIVENGVSEI